MKKLTFFTIVVMISVTGFGQTTKGKYFVSGSTGLQFIAGNTKSVYDGETDYEYNTSTFSIIPSFGYFVMDNLAIGLATNFTSASEKDEDGDKYVTNAFLIVPTVVSYFAVDDKVKPFVQVGVGFGTNTNKYTPKNGDNDKYSYNGIAFNIGAGISYFVKENVAFNFGVSYTKSTYTDGDDDKDKMKQGNFAGSVGIAIFF